MNLESNQDLLHYRLIEKIGEGGMGVVWKAEDTSLKRQVAIKVLPDLANATGAQPAERLERFGREARLLATLNHPNIAAVYGLHEVDGMHFLAMEFVDGEDLSSKIARGPIPVDEAVEIAKSIAEALTTAHANGVIHRDLKPANIRLTPEGQVKVLDFGLAKALANDPMSGEATSMSMSPTITSLGTVAGVLLGTAAYMSPEQARGKPVDKRADVWAFGVVLYEMLVGKCAFAGETITDTLAAVVRGEPDWDALPKLPWSVERVLRLCLTKDPKKRLHDAGDALLLFDEPETEATVERRSKLALLGWVVAGIAIVAMMLIAQLGGQKTNNAATSTDPIRFHVPLGRDEAIQLGDQPILAISRDGRKIVFAAAVKSDGSRMLYVRNLEQDTVIPIPRTEGARSPFYSPDGESLAFFARGKLLRVTPGQGEPIPLADAPNARGGVWLEDGTIIFSPDFSQGLWRVPAAGGNAVEILALDPEREERTFRWPTVAPDGKTVIFTVGHEKSPNNYDNAYIDAYTLPNGPRKRLIEGANVARMAGQTRLAYYVEGSIRVVGYNAGTNEIVGDPVVSMTGVGGDSSSGAAYFDISDQGDLVHVNFDDEAGKSRLTLVERDGTKQILDLPAGGYSSPEFSPDGNKIIVQIGSGRGLMDADIWIYDIRDKGLRRVTFSGSSFAPIWRDDGDRIAFNSGDQGSIKMSNADGSNPRDLVAPNNDVFGFSGAWSAVNGTVAFVIVGGETNIVRIDEDAGSLDENAVWVVDAAGPNFSPDGKYMTYFSPPMGGGSRAFVVEVDGSRQWQVSSDYGVYPRWSPDGNSIFYLAGNLPGRPLFEVAVDTSDGFKFSMPRQVLEDTTEFQTITAPGLNWDTDGERFVFVEPVRDAVGLSRVLVTLHWADSVDVDGGSQ